ncbi:ribosome maturation factor RimM [Sphingomonas sp. RP10(2022)]|uniref:Ribosome maturation factor RimM n=1 Tax=Sphingomonas liriopis TaxID=2949094 RepID=A0A9X2HR96_9SPHN|nr:ribosome maturation factor RimM [Sphingomonas liriopis]MCP3734407.1 ribosome maturation factor RimM [Sphingomonas liriopis]
MPPQEPTDRRADGNVTLAVVIGAHGVNGQVRLKVFAEDFGSYKSFNQGALTLKSAQAGNNGLIVRFAEIADRNAAEALRGTELTVPRSALPPLADGEYYHADLLGLPAVSSDGEPLGTVVLIENFGAGDVLEIERPDGKRFMIPMNIDAVLGWDGVQLVVNADFVE